MCWIKRTSRTNKPRKNRENKIRRKSGQNKK